MLTNSAFFKETEYVANQAFKWKRLGANTDEAVKTAIKYLKCARAQKIGEDFCEELFDKYAELYANLAKVMVQHYSDYADSDFGKNPRDE